MGQTPEGAKKAAATKKLLYGEDFHRKIGAKGGKKSKRELPRTVAKVVGRKGGKAKKGWRKKPT